MRPIIIASATALGFVMSTQAPAMDQLGKYQSNSRVLVLFGGSGDQKLARQVEVLRGKQSELADRDMVVFTVIGDAVRPIYGETTGVDARKLRKEADIEDNTFQAVLIGKDGGVKLRSSHVVTNTNMFGLIDRMPMRKAGQG